MPSGADAELPPTEEQMAEIATLQRMRGGAEVSVPVTQAEAVAEIRRLWAS